MASNNNATVDKNPAKTRALLKKTVHLFEAASRGDLISVKTDLADKDWVKIVNQQLDFGTVKQGTVLHAAASKGQTGVARLLVEIYAADPFFRDAAGKTPDDHLRQFYFEVENSDEMDVDQNLVSIEDLFYKKQAAFFAACHEDKLAEVRQMLVDPRLVQAENVENVPLESFINPRSLQLLSARFDSAKHGSGTISDYYHWEEGSNALMFTCCRKGAPKTAKFLLDVAAELGKSYENFDVKNFVCGVTKPNSWQPIQAASFWGLLECCRHLCDTGSVDLESKRRWMSVDGWTVLMLAADRGNLSTVEFLVQRGASMSTRRGDGKTSMEIAGEREHKKTVDLLFQLYAKQLGFED